MRGIKYTKLTDKSGFTKSTLTSNRMMRIGSLAMSFAVLVALMSVESDERDLAWRIAVGAFALSIPMLVLQAFNQAILENYQIMVNHLALDSSELIGIWGGIVGMGATFWHLAWWSAILFSASSVFVLVLLVMLDSASAERGDLFELQTNSDSDDSKTE